MNKALQSYNESIKGKMVFFLGAGVSHRELIPQYIEKGASVTLCDKKPFESFGEYGETLKKLGVGFRLGEGYLEHLDDADIVFRSPGIDYTKPEIQAAVAAGVEVTSEMETFFELCPCRIIAVTGSDGKTTTTTLASEILKVAGYRVWLGGNLGVPLLPVIDEVSEDDLAVVELSSFQLISMKRSPSFALVTNVSPNHLDHHKDMREYIDAKRNILIHQKPGDVAVLFEGNDVTLSMRADVRGELRMFGRERTENGAYIESDGIYAAKCGKAVRVLELSDITLRGEHNRDNVCGAVALTMSLADPATVREAVRSFKGVEHRIEFVRKLRNISWYNDSIGTSPTRTLAGLRSFEQKLILIAGGSDKGVPFDPLAPEILKSVKLLLLCGATSDKIEAAVRSDPGFASSGLVIERLADIPACVARANAVAVSGDTVMLSPASPSFDAYANFEERGRHFKQLVNELE